MNKMIKTIITLAIVMTGLVISGCTDSEPTTRQQFNHTLPVVPVAVDVTIGEVLENPYAHENIRVTGIVNQTIDVEGYTYMEITDSTGSLWVAGYSTQLDNGTEITATGSLQTEFSSTQLGRTFNIILFADSISNGNASVSNSPHGSGTIIAGNITGDINVTPVDGGTRIEDINSMSAALDGQVVKVSAVVVKNMELIDEYFLTLDDGTGQLKAKCPKTFSVSQGDSVVVTGSVMTDVDLGSGYYYEVLLQITDVE
ncbi:MAG: hypothetical protein C5S40_03010 [ANME-2 cluster archaeon]|nr:hypothetical protein [ANME-2 cluster archaeon]